MLFPILRKACDGVKTNYVDGHLEAELIGRYAGLVKLAVGGKLNNVVAGAQFGSRINPSVTIALTA
jgi:hypothetical protein